MVSNDKASGVDEAAKKEIASSIDAVVNSYGNNKKITEKKEDSIYDILKKDNAPVFYAPEKKLDYSKLFSYLENAAKKDYDKYQDFKESADNMASFASKKDKENYEIAKDVIKEKAFADALHVNVGYKSLEQREVFQFWKLFHDAENKLFYSLCFL